MATKKGAAGEKSEGGLGKKYTIPRSPVYIAWQRKIDKTGRGTGDVLQSGVAKLLIPDSHIAWFNIPESTANQAAQNQIKWIQVDSFTYTRATDITGNNTVSIAVPAYNRMVGINKGKPTGIRVTVPLVDLLTPGRPEANGQPATPGNRRTASFTFPKGFTHLMVLQALGTMFKAKLPYDVRIQNTRYQYIQITEDGSNGLMTGATEGAWLVTDPSTVTVAQPETASSTIAPEQIA